MNSTSGGDGEVKRPIFAPDTYPMNCDCGGRLLHATGDETITSDGGAHTYQRENLYLLCPDCLRLYSQSRLNLNETHGVELADQEAASILSMIAEEPA